MSEPNSKPDPHSIRSLLAQRAGELGFARIGVAGIDLAADERRFDAWLAAGRHGEMGYMARHGAKRSRPAELLPGTLRVISARMDYWPSDARSPGAVLGDGAVGYVSRYALGRDYHRLMRKALQRLADYLATLLGPHGHRVYVDSAPVLEKALARNAGLGWIGKHTNLIARDAGSYFFLGEIYTDLELPVDEPASAHCGSCTACMPACPTGAIVAPWQLDARRCISYLTIELQGSIPVELRGAIGNRIYGCDDCQLVCPWNRYARTAAHPDFKVRHGLDAARLSALFAWTGAEFAARMRGSAIHRLGYRRWLRNIAVALGNAATSDEIIAALESRRHDGEPLVREHVRWALARHGRGAPQHESG
ncbi:MAG: tRNA epoxyqueuosine(34) reductase QueG [Gammaproteobacteria bacterium]|nr:tRNA epoxyqueuosine(34) reductase QueG [Gammaproteobacteria bacterium]MDE2251220.1 tRNA epoxyqueuosine(34) reductase QueG [Gammaproteobacteria bacterium]